PSRAPGVRSIGQRLLHARDPVGVRRVLVIGSFHVLQLDRHAGDLAGELEGSLISFGDRRSLVGTDVRALVGRVEAALRSLDPPRRDLLAVHEDRALAAFARAASVVGELEADRRLPRGQRLRGSHGVALQAEPVVRVGWLAILYIEAPAAEP